MKPLAYHITWGTYGTRLHGGPRPTVDRNFNEYGTPVLEFDEYRYELAQERLKYDPIMLTAEQMIFVEDVVPGICERGHWRYRTCAAGPDHVHVLLTATFDPEKIRALLKRWIGQALSEKWTLEGEERTWWAECGSIKWVDSERYLTKVTDYVTKQRARRR